MSNLENSRRVLMVSYLYPPMDGVGTIRTRKFAKYLPESGYEPIVLAAQPTQQDPVDDAPAAFRVRDPGAAARAAYHALRAAAGSRRRNAGAQSPIHKSRLGILPQTLLTPDEEVLWYFPATRKGREILRQTPALALYSTSPPETNHLVGLTLKRATGLPWIADFRDGWMFEPLRPARKNIRARCWVETNMERHVVTSADRVIAANEVIAEDLCARYPTAGYKVRVITNGYDPDDFADLQRSIREDHRFRLVHTGRIAKGIQGRSIHFLLDAVCALSARQARVLRDLEIRLVGDLSVDEIESIHRSGVGHIFTISGPVPYKCALQEQLDADVLLLITSPGSLGNTPAKLYEYIAAGVPIVALSDSCSVKTLFDVVHSGTMVTPGDVEGICGAIETLHKEWLLGPRNVPVQAKQFDRRRLTVSLAQELASIVQPGKGR